jgi:hypothetical protein
MMRDYDQARAFARSQHRNPRAEGWHNACQMFSRQCVGAVSFGASARIAFESTSQNARHRSQPPPPGAIAYYGHPGVGNGHAVFVVEGGYVWSNDIVRAGHIDRVKWNVFDSRWNLPYRGWIDSCPSGKLPVQQNGHLADYRQGGKVFASKMRHGQADSDSVWNLQLALIRKGYKIPEGPHCYYGAHCLAACAAFQRRQKWSGSGVDGIAGAETVRRLGLVWIDG